MDTAIEGLFGFLEKIVTAQPWTLTVLASLVILGVAALFIVGIMRVRSGEEFTLGPIKLAPNAKVQELTTVVEQHVKNFNTLNEDAKQKTQILKLLDQAYLEVSDCICTIKTMKEFNDRKADIYKLILYGMGTILTKEKANAHRTAIFVEEPGTGNLMIYEGFGFSPGGKKNLRLPIHNSAAGYTYRTGEIYSDGDIRAEGKQFKVNPLASRVYDSLICVPIKSGEKMIGVLSIDGQEKNSFSKDDEVYMTYFANALSILMLFDKVILKQTGEVDINGQSTSGIQLEGSLP
ncbi:GAF domain-containing protein [Paenibacillus sp. S-38]|uniref:GAF domain-containing protein n=1 Tax=Paenibacillus sp. S-38 TaxID=3416710 RepID=UPI003CE8C696